MGHVGQGGAVPVLRVRQVGVPGVGAAGGAGVPGGCASGGCASGGCARVRQVGRGGTGPR